MGDEGAVLAARNTNENAVAVLDEFELDHRAHEFAEIRLRYIDIHES